MDQAVKDRKVRVRASLALVALLAALTPASGNVGQESGSTSSSARRVERFTRPAEMRIKPPADAKGTRPNQACPNTLDMCRKFWALARHFLDTPTIPVRDRELLVLRTAYLSRVDYEWGHHYGTYGPKAGLTQEEMSRLMQGPEAKGWSPFDAALLRAADELHAMRFITEPTWKTLAGRYTDQQLVEVVLTVGNYTLLGMYFNALGVPVEPGHSRVPD